MPEQSEKYSVDDLMTLMARLREPGTGCPWDIQQTYRTIVPSTLEEAYEVADAIETENFGHLKEELGDLLFQVVFYSQLGAEEQRFTFPEIVSDLVGKLVRRHPHVFPDGTLSSRVELESARDEAKIKARWEVMKQVEREEKGQRGVLDDIPLNLPALTRASKLQKRASNVGFDWPDTKGVIDKIEEELQEVREAQEQGDHEAMAEELGDLLFAVVNLTRHLKVDGEGALRAANKKFERRFRFIEETLAEKGQSPEKTSLKEMDRLWNSAKGVEKEAGK